MNDTPSDTQVRNRWLAIVLVRLAGSAGAVFGVVLLSKADDTPERILGIAIVLAALWMIGTVPRALAHRWRTPPDAGSE